jgi:hypothetical protein
MKAIKQVDYNSHFSSDNHVYALIILIELHEIGDLAFEQRYNIPVIVMLSL